MNNGDITWDDIDRAKGFGRDRNDAASCPCCGRRPATVSPDDARANKSPLTSCPGCKCRFTGNPLRRCNLAN